jgi:hypothetical protein
MKAGSARLAKHLLTRTNQLNTIIEPLFLLEGSEIEMPTTIPAGFLKLRENLEITGLQSTDVSTRQQGVRAVVGNEMIVQSSFLGGSYQRSTMIAPLSDADIDIFIVLDSSYWNNYTPSALLDRIRTILLKPTRLPRKSAETGKRSLSRSQTSKSMSCLATIDKAVGF